jgi:FdhD protein
MTSQVFEKTGAVHSCAVCMRNEILFFSEDIGIHNAIDKAAGACVLNSSINPNMFLLTSGRITLEAVKKVHNAGFSMIVSCSAPTDLAINFAKKNDICIADFQEIKDLISIQIYKR